MTKKNVVKICNIISIVLIIIFVVKSIINYFQYSPLSNSAPFYAWILLNALYLLVPAIIIYIVGYIVKNKK